MIGGLRGPALALAAGGALIGIAACGSSSSTTSSPASTASSASSASTSGGATAAATTDSCVVGKWVAASTSGSTTIGSDTPSFSGGEGELLTINADGSFVDDFSAAKPVTGSAGGHQYAITTAGKSTGTATSSAGKVTITITDTTTVSQTVTQDGTSLGTAHPPSTQTAAYACQSGGFTVTSSGITTTYAPAP